MDVDRSQFRHVRQRIGMRDLRGSEYCTSCRDVRAKQGEFTKIVMGKYRRKSSTERLLEFIRRHIHRTKIGANR